MNPTAGTLLIWLTFGAVMHATEAKDSEAAPTASSTATAAPTIIHAEKVTLVDGRELTGNYSDETQVMTLLNAHTGKSDASLTIPLSQTKVREAIDIVIKSKSSADHPEAKGFWTTDYATAEKSATELNRPILIDFTGSDWCPWCKKLHQEVFNTEKFRDWASKNVILLEVDFPKHKTLPASMVKANQALSQKYSVRGYPDIVMVDAKGKMISESGYLAGGATVWIADLTSRPPFARKP